MPMRAERGPVRQDVAEQDADDDVSDVSDHAPAAPVHRTFFPETWLWRLERMRLVGHNITFACSISNTVAIYGKRN